MGATTALVPWVVAAVVVVTMAAEEMEEVVVTSCLLKDPLSAPPGPMAAPPIWGSKPTDVTLQRVQNPCRTVMRVLKATPPTASAAGGTTAPLLREIRAMIKSPRLPIRCPISIWAKITSRAAAVVPCPVAGVEASGETNLLASLEVEGPSRIPAVTEREMSETVCC